MATIKNNKLTVVKKDLQKLNKIFESHTGMMVLTVGSLPIENWIDFETDLQIILNDRTIKLFNKNIN